LLSPPTPRTIVRRDGGRRFLFFFSFFLSRGLWRETGSMTLFFPVSSTSIPSFLPSMGWSKMRIPSLYPFSPPFYLRRGGRKRSLFFLSFWGQPLGGVKEDAARAHCHFFFFPPGMPTSTSILSLPSPPLCPWKGLDGMRPRHSFFSLRFVGVLNKCNLLGFPLFEWIERQRITAFHPFFPFAKEGQHA